MSDDKKINWHPPMQMPESNPVIQFTQKVKHPEKIKINFKLPQWKLKNRNSSLDITLSPAAKKLYNEWRTVLEEEAKIEAVNKPKYYKSDPDISKKFFSELEASAKRLNCNPEDLAAIIYRESHFDPAAKDCTGTYHGLIQMDKTALENSIKFNLENFGNKCGLNPKMTYNKYKKLPREACVAMATAGWGDTGFAGLAAGDEFADAPTATAPIAFDTAADLCTAADETSLALFFY